MKDRAYIVGNDPDLVQEVVKREGIWLCGDSTDPTAMIVIISKGGKLYAITPAQELNPNKFFPTVKFWGPFLPEDIG